MPKSTKPKTVKVPVTISLPRHLDTISTEVDIDPDDFRLSAQLTRKEIEDVAYYAITAKLKVKLDTDGRSVIAQIKAASRGDDA